MKRQTKVVLVSGLFLVGALVHSNQVLAYEAGDTDPIQNNQQTLDKVDNGDMELKGWIGTFDPTEAPDPEQPTPSDKDSSWVNVTMPVTVLFGSLESDKGNIYGPAYAIKNNSVKSVKVSAQNVTAVANAINSGLELNMSADNGKVTVPLVKNDGSLLDKAAEIKGLATGESVDFTLQGKFSGVYPTIESGPLTPKYNLSLKFDVQ
ncbi:hypothetical protein ACWOC1_11615 [Enterococcus quebecensis]|uniref:WxL domain-containing protein n=1 Tax=Enterococcus quebecensis TaxID=903983 RepID=A0A1E5GS60_9ENTE|nr:hypothetical protein [Enterococcus quebecensis]OEG15543.1 hypothetical protein BCR23_08745 [Enterococcus quebecensis]OJG74674.1 hypothetical protein RV12_GL002429 [Enterococcus quebecensis]